MECEKTPLLKQLAVHEPEALAIESWRTHVQECADCYNEWSALTASLAVYRHVECEDAARRSFRPSWEAYAQRLQEERSERRRSSWLAASWLAGMAGLILFGGAMSWGLWSNDRAQPSTVFVLDSNSLNFGFPRESLPALTSVTAWPSGQMPASTASGGYSLDTSEHRMLSRLRLLEPYTSAAGRPSGEMAIIPFSHDNGATPFVMPVTSAPRSGIRLRYVNAADPQGGYILTSPVH
jgi:hypothetical protein